MTDELQMSYENWVESGKVFNSPAHNALATELLRLTERLANGRFIRNTLLHAEAIGDANFVLAQVLRNYAPEKGSMLTPFAIFRINGSFQDTSRRLDIYGSTMRDAIEAYKELSEEKLAYSILRERMENGFTKETVRDAEALVYAENQPPPAEHVDRRADTTRSAHRSAQRIGIRQIFMKTINALPDRQNRIMMMMKWDGEKTKDIAAHLNLSAPATSLRMKGARNDMRGYLERRGLTYEAF